jgi:amidohydrolase
VDDLPYRSTKKSVWQGKEVLVSHACGHDTHVAMLLGAADALSQMQEELPGTIVFLFQPAEEFGPGPVLSGAPAMVEAGVLENPKVDIVMGQHINTAFPSGRLQYRRGALMSSGESLSISLMGNGGHGSMPWKSTSPMLAAAEIMLAMQNIISHRIDPMDGATILTFGTLNSGTRKNVLPDTAELSGTLRSLSTSNQKIAHENIHLIAENIAEAYRVKADVKINTGGYEVPMSDPDITEELIPALQQSADAKGAIETLPSTGSEDFGSYGADIPVVFWFLSASPYPDKAGAPSHSTEFVVDEAALRVGVRALVNSAVLYMENRTSSAQ